MISKEVRILGPHDRDCVDTLRVILLYSCSRTVFPELVEVFGPDLVYKFIDLFGGVTIKVPDRHFLEQAVRDIDIYRTMSNGVRAEALKYLAIKHDTTEEYVRERYVHVKRLREKYGI